MIGIMPDIENMKIYTYEISKGKFKGKVVKSYESNAFIYGITNPWVACFDDNGKEYCIFWNELKEIKVEDMPEEVKSELRQYLNKGRGD